MTRRTFLTYTGMMVVFAVAGAVVHGHLSDRWGGYTTRLQAAARTLESVPDAFGDWQLAEETELTDRVQGILNCAASVNRKYEHRKTGQVVSMAMIVGPPGPTASHFAEMCYTTQGYKTLNKGVRFQLVFPNDVRQEFYEDNFASPGVLAQKLQVCYSWRQADRWLVPTIPRVTFGGHPYLYKIQVAAYFAEGAAGETDGICRGFLQDLLPELEQTVFGKSAP